MPHISINSTILAYGDTSVNSNPSETYANWKKNILVKDVENPQNTPHTLAPAESLTVFDGLRDTNIANDTEFDLDLSPSGETSRYRFAWNGNGTAPGFRAERTLTINGEDVTIAVLPNQTATLTSTGDLSDIEVGDIVYIDPEGPMNSLNVGYWTVIGLGEAVQMTRSDGVFSAYAETVEVETLDIQAFSASGVQIGDKVKISDGFASTTKRTYSVLEVNPRWIEVLSTSPLASETDILPSDDGMVFYTDSKRWIYVESLQECVIKINGDTTENTTITPWSAGDKNFPAQYMVTGPVYSLVILNKATVPCKVNVISVE